jgi:hypothetical protein
VTPTPNQAVILERISNVQADICDLVELSRAIESRFSTFEKSYLVEHAAAKAKTKENSDRLAVQQEQIVAIENRLKDIERLMPFLKPIAYIITGLSIPITLALLALLWQLLTHQTVLP